MKPTAQLPQDPALPGLEAIRTGGLAAAIPSLALEDEPVELLLSGYTAGERATLEARVGSRHFAVKAYADDTLPEAELYRALADAGLAGDSGPRVPPLLACDRDLKVLVIGWLDGPSAHELIKNGQGERAGELVARWLNRQASLTVNLGPPVSAPRLLDEDLALLQAADAALGAAGTALSERLARSQPDNGRAHLVHGTFYDRHVLDVGGDPGVIDWQRFGQGPLELDAGMFLATVTRAELLRKRNRSGEAQRAREALLAGTAGVLDQQALAWHWSAALLRLAEFSIKRQRADRAATLLHEAGRLADLAG